MPAGGATLVFFDYIPFENTTIDGHNVRFHLYTLSGNVENPGAWKMILKGVDGLAIVLEAGREASGESSESLLMLRSVLASCGRSFDALPTVLISSKSDLAAPALDDRWLSDLPYLAREATSIISGDGVINSIVTLSKGVFRQLQEECCLLDKPSDEPAPADLIELSVHELADDLSGPVNDLTGQAAVVIKGDSVVKIPVILDVGGVTKKLVIRVELSLEEVSEAGLE